MTKITIGLVIRYGTDIEETLHGIMNQDYPHEDMEIVIVIGGTKKGIPKFNQYLESKLDVKSRVYYDDGMGLGAARQIVVDNALGDFILWLDGDVILANDFGGILLLTLSNSIPRMFSFLS